MLRMELGNYSLRDLTILYFIYHLKILPETDEELLRGVRKKEKNEKILDNF